MNKFEEKIILMLIYTKRISRASIIDIKKYFFKIKNATLLIFHTIFLEKLKIIAEIIILLNVLSSQYTLNWKQGGV